MPLGQVLRLFAVEGVRNAPQDEDVELDPAFTFGLFPLLFLLNEKYNVSFESFTVLGNDVPLARIDVSRSFGPKTFGPKSYGQLTIHQLPTARQCRHLTMWQ